MTLLKALILSLALSLPAFATTSVNINTADAGAIAKGLSGIGPRKAEAIVEYRKQHGAFKSVDELTHIKGINAKTVAKNRDVIALNGDTKIESKAAAKAATAKSAAHSGGADTDQ